MARRKGTQSHASDESGEDRELSDEELQEQQEARRQKAMASPFSAESDQNLTEDYEANGGETEPAPELAVVKSGKDGGEPVRENRREKRLREERAKGPLARYKFRVMVGSMIGQDYEEPIIEDPETGEPRKDRRRPSKMFKTGDTVWANVDLAKKHNRPSSIKFRLVEDFGDKAYTDGIDPTKNKEKIRIGGQTKELNEEERVDLPKRKDLEGMNLGELRQYAANEEFDLTGCHTKDDVINVILREQKAAAKAQRGN